MKQINNYIVEKLHITKDYKCDWKVDDFVSYLTEHNVVVDDKKSTILNFISLPKTRFPYFAVYFRKDGWTPFVGDTLEIWSSTYKSIEINVKDYFQMDKAKKNCLYNEDNAKIIIRLLLRTAEK